MVRKNINMKALKVIFLRKLLINRFTKLNFLSHFLER